MACCGIGFHRLRTPSRTCWSPPASVGRVDMELAESEYFSRLDELYERPCWLEPQQGSHFSIRNLPYGIYSTYQDTQRRIGIAIENSVLDVSGGIGQGLFDVLHLSSDSLHAIRQPQLNAWAEQSQATHRSFRLHLLKLLTDSEYESRVRPHLIQRSSVTLHLPFHIGDYSDFFAGIHHAQTCGQIFRNSSELSPNYKQIPVGYHGRVSSIVPSGRPVRRPSGITRDGSDRGGVQFGTCTELDVEVELAAFIGHPSHGTPINAVDAESYIFGYVLMNDWSARDIQRYEAQPLGPFLGKSFATTISSWVVTSDALRPARCECSFDRDNVMPHLTEHPPHTSSFIDVDLTLSIIASGTEFVFSKTNGRYLYWSFRQMVAHHSSNGCPLIPGDLIGSGTISGPHAGSEGSFLEMSRNGTRDCVGQAIDGREVKRRWVLDHDEVIITGTCRPGIGFGECRGQVIP